MIFETAIPVFFWPTTIVMIDDDPVCLKNLSRLFRLNKTILFTNPNEGIEYINENKMAVVDSDEFSYDIDQSSERNDFLAILNLYKKMYKGKRFSDISTLVIDYDMPQCDGLTAINKVTNKSIKKLLLTGIANEKLAVHSFNDKKIDYYIKKMDADADLELRKYVDLMQVQYFIDKSRKIIGRNEQLKNLLEHPAFIQLFSEMVNNHNIIEFCLIDEYGSFLMMDAEGQLAVLMIQDQDDVSSLANLALEIPFLTKDDATHLKNKTKMFFYLTLPFIEESDKSFHQYLVDCKKIEELNLYWSFSHDVSFLDIKPEKVTKFSL